MSDRDLVLCYGSWWEYNNFCRNEVEKKKVMRKIAMLQEEIEKRTELSGKNILTGHKKAGGVDAPGDFFISVQNWVWK